MRKYKYVLFDLDGTISDPKIGITKSFQYALQHLGIEVEDLDELEPVIGPPLKDSFMEFYHLTEEQAMVGIEKYRERFSVKGWCENTIYPGMKELLEELAKEGCKLAIASSKPTVFVEQICDYFEITPYFSYRIGSFLDGKRGTKDQVVEEAIRLLGGEESKKDMVMIGDRKFDVLGGHAHNLPVIGVSFGYGGREELQEAGADWIADSVEELRRYLL